jgi:hypothetical protein
MQNKMKLKSTIDLVKSYPQMLMKPMLRDRLRVFLMLRLKFHQIPKYIFGGSCNPWYFHRRHKTMNSQTYFQEKNYTPFPSVLMSYAGHQFGNWWSIRRRKSHNPRIENKEQVLYVVKQVEPA